MTPNASVVAAFLLYAGACVLVGWLGFRHMKRANATPGKDKGDEGAGFLLAGRRLGTLFVIAALITAWTGAGSVVGGVSFASRTGLGYFWLAGDILAILLLVALAPTIRRVARYTTPEVLEKRYGPSARLASSFVTFCAYTAIAGTQTLAGGTLLSVVLGPEAILGNTFLYGTLLFASVFIAYTALGGLTSLAYVALLQGVLMFGGLLALVAAGLARVGGIGELARAVPATHLSPVDSVGWAAGLAPFLAVFLLLVCDQSTWQRLVASRDDRSASLGVRGFLVLILALHACFLLIGMLARVLVPDAPVNQEALQLVAALLPDWFAALVYVSFAAIIMSTASAFFLSASTNVVKDVYQRFVDPDASEATLRRTSRVALVAVACGAVALALTHEEAIRLALLSYYVYVSGIAVPLLAALFSRRATTAGAVASIAAGFGVILLWEVPWLAGEGLGAVTGIGPFLPALAAAILALVVGSALTPPPPAEKVDAFASAPSRGATARHLAGFTLLLSAASTAIFAYAALPELRVALPGFSLAAVLGYVGAGTFAGRGEIMHRLAGVDADDATTVTSPWRASLTAWGAILVAGGFFGLAHSTGYAGAGFALGGLVLLGIASRADGAAVARS